MSNSKHRRRPYLDAATRYRCYHPAEDLQEMDYQADVCALTDFKSKYIVDYDVFIFHRPTYSGGIRNTIKKLIKQKKIVIADYDDLIFDPRYATDTPPYLSGSASATIVKKLCSRHLQALKLFNFITVSTVPLAEAVKVLNPEAKVGIIHNGLSKRWTEAAKCYSRVITKTRKIVYFSGTKSHDFDFKIVENCLAEYVNRYDDLVFEVVGSLDFDKTKFAPGKLSTHPHVDYMDLPSLIKCSWVTIAPLQDNGFNWCKSGLKFFESAIFGVPVVATPIPDILRFDGGGILLAKNPIEWMQALDLLQDPMVYEKISKAIMSYTKMYCFSGIQTENFVKFIKRDGFLPD